MAAAVCFEPTLYTLQRTCPIAWPATMAANASASFARPPPPPPPTTTESAVAFARRRCSETLWLPETVMSVLDLVRALRRPELYTHDVLDALLGSARAIQERYHDVLPRLLDGDNADEQQEDPLFWTAWKNAPEDTAVRDFLEKHEQREVQIQVLLHMLNLTLPPAPSPPQPTASSSRKRKRSSPRKPPTADHGLPSVDVRLEFFMDKLSMWQLTTALAAPPVDDAPKQKDWAQRFCEDVVEPLFSDALPDQCALLRSKLFREHVPRGTASPSRSPSPVLSRATSRGPERAPSPLSLGDLKREHSRGPSAEPDANRARSRSRSLSITVDEMASKGASRGGIVTSRALFRNQAVPVRTHSAGSGLGASKKTKEQPDKLSVPRGPFAKTKSAPLLPTSTTTTTTITTLVPDTPVKQESPEARRWFVPESPDQRAHLVTSSPDTDGVGIVLETPTKKPVRRR